MCKLTLKQQHGERDRWREEFLSSKQAKHPQGISYFKAQTEISLNRIKGHFPKGRTGTPSFLAVGMGWQDKTVKFHHLQGIPDIIVFRFRFIHLEKRRPKGPRMLVSALVLRTAASG